MKAVLCYKYGSPDVLQIKDIPKPVPTGKEVLVKVKATTINDWDWSLVRGKPYVYRLIFGLFKPKKPIFGVELAGVVEACGPAVSRFKPGDRVYGDVSLVGWGGWAEFASVPEQALLAIPQPMSFEEAASLPHAAALAYQGLVTEGGLSEGQKILINGGGGGVGTLGVQMAKTVNIHVTGVDSQEKFPMMRELGFDELIDYKKTDFTKTGEQYDLILDTKSTRPPRSYLKALKPDGKYVTVGGGVFRMLQLAVWKGLFSSRSQKQLKILALKPNEGLEKVAEWFLAGQVRTVIDGPYPLEQIPELLEYFGNGRHKGKIVISLND